MEDQIEVKLRECDCDSFKKCIPLINSCMDMWQNHGGKIIVPDNFEYFEYCPYCGKELTQRKITAVNKPTTVQEQKEIKNESI